MKNTWINLKCPIHQKNKVSVNSNKIPLSNLSCGICGNILVEDSSRNVSEMIASAEEQICEKCGKKVIGS